MIPGHLDLLLLGTIQPAPSYGPQIIARVEQPTDGTFLFREGTLYPALPRLQQQGLVTSDFLPSDTGGPPDAPTPSRPPDANTSAADATTGRPSRAMQALTLSAATDQAWSAPPTPTGTSSASPPH